MRKEPGTVSALTENADPVRRWHRLQWQYSEPRSGSVTSKRTPSHMQPPVRDIAAARYYRCAASTERGIGTVALPRATALSVSGGLTGVPSALTTWPVIEIATDSRARLN